MQIIPDSAFCNSEIHRMIITQNKTKYKGLMHLKTQSFVTGALILMIANAISKILGAVFKIPLTYIIGEEGMAVYNTAFNIYILFLAFVISGLPFAVSKLVSEYSAAKKEGMVRYTVKISNLILCAVGLFGSAALYFGADFFAFAMKEEKAVFAIKMIAPSIFFVAAGTTVRSYYQGISNMLPTAVSQVIESVVKLVAGYVLAVYFIRFGISAASGGAVMGVTIGEAVATAVFLLIYIFSPKPSCPCSLKDRQEIRKALFDIALPLLFASVVSSMLSVVDTTVIRSGLIHSGLNTDEARRVYGAYTGYALTVIHLPIGILATLGVSILPVIAGSLAIGQHEKTQKASYLALQLTILLAVPCAVAAYCLSTELLEVLFHNSTSAAMLSMTAPCIIMICISNILMSIIQSAGKIMTAFFYSAAGAVLKILLSVVLMPKLGIYGAIFSANISYFIVMLCCLIGIKKILGLKFKITETIIKPGFGAAVMYLLIELLRKPLGGILSNALLYTAAIGTISLIGYAAALALTGALNPKQFLDIRKSAKNY